MLLAAPTETQLFDLIHRTRLLSGMGVPLAPPVPSQPATQNTPARPPQALAEPVARDGATGGVPEPPFLPVPTPAEQKILDALCSPTQLEFVDTPLKDIVDYLGDIHHIKIQLDKKAMDAAGIRVDAKVTKQTRKLALRSALRLMLYELDLTYLVQDGVLLITTRETAENRLTTRIYLVTDLVATQGDFQPLIDAIRATIQPGAGREQRGPGSLVGQSTGHARVLVCTQAQDAHEKILDLLGALREVKAAAAKGRQATAALDVPKPGPAERKIETALASPTQFDFVDVPLEDVVDYLNDYHQIEIQLDKKAMDKAGIRADSQLTKKIKGVTLSAALRLLLHELNLSWVIQDEVLFITPTEAAENRLVTRIYPVTDIVGRKRDKNGKVDADLTPLLQTIEATVFPETWNDVGGPGSIAPIPLGNAEVLVISQTQAVHKEIAALLAGLRKAQPAGAPPAPPPGPGPAAPAPTPHRPAEVRSGIGRHNAEVETGACCGPASATAVSAQEAMSNRRLMMDAGKLDVLALAFSPDGKTLAAGRRDGGITLWDVAAKTARASLPGHRKGQELQGVFFSSVAFSPDGKTLASASGDKTVRLWNVATGKNFAALEGHQDAVRRVAFSPDGKTLASITFSFGLTTLGKTADKTVKLWNAETRRNIETFSGDGFLSLAFSPDGTRLAASCLDRTIRLWDVKTGVNTGTLPVRDRPYVESVAFSPDGKTLAAAGCWNEDTPSRLHDVKTLLLDVKTGKTVRVLPGDDAVQTVAFSPDGKILALATINYRIELWDVATAHRIAVWHGGPAVAFSPDGKTLAASGYEDEQDGGAGVSLWDVRQIKKVDKQDDATTGKHRP